MRVAIFAALLALPACSWVLPRPTPPLNPVAERHPAGQCSLELMESRRNLTRGVEARGTPTLLIVRRLAGAGADRRIREGDSVYFVDAAEASGASAAGAPGEPLDSSTWVLETRARADEKPGPQAPLGDGTALRLRAADGSGYLMVNEMAATSVPRSDSSRLRILKADAPNPARPSTCDELIRDGDYVFLYALSPRAWLAASRGSVLALQRAAGAACTSNEERCYTDHDGGLVCAWSPVCRRAP